MPIRKCFIVLLLIKWLCLPVLAQADEPSLAKELDQAEQAVRDLTPPDEAKKLASMTYDQQTAYAQKKIASTPKDQLIKQYNKMREGLDKITRIARE